MGGCVASCFACCNNCKTGVNNFQKKIKEGGPQAVPVENGDGYITYRYPNSKDLSQDDINNMYTKDVPTMVHFLKTTCEKYAKSTAYAYRKIEKTSKEKQADGKELEVYHLGNRTEKTFTEMWAQVVGFANGLKALGIENGRKVAIYEDTRAEWICSAYGIWAANATPVTVYANLGEDALIYALKESEVEVVICNAKQVKKLKSLCVKNEINLKTVIYTDELTDEKDDQGNSILEGCSSWTSVVDSGLGKEMPECTLKSEDLAVIMYTSGTTGDPKGVMLTQGNVVSAVLGIGSRLGNVADGVENPTYIAYLPLAHILEFAAENYMYYRGYTVCYSNPRVLSNTAARPHGDLQEYKPVLFAGVPRVFDTFKKVVESRLPPIGSTARTVYERAVVERKACIARGETTPFLDEKVFGNTRAILGGRCRWIISGGAPLSAKTHEWMQINLCGDGFVSQGYGLTETGAACTIQNYWDYQFENTGGLLPNVEVKLRNAEAYKVTDKPYPRGEVCIRGPSVAQGYFKQPEKTKEAFLEDGFFATGDVGEIGEDGTLKIVGRVKALAKNAHGEYIAMEALESVYVQNELVLPNGICIVVDSHQPFIIAVALTDEGKAMKFAKENKLEGSYPEILKDQKFINAALVSLAKTAKENGKKPFETIKNVRFYADEWTPENGVLTAAMKLKRREIDARYADDIKIMIDEKAQ